MKASNWITFVFFGLSNIEFAAPIYFNTSHRTDETLLTAIYRRNRLHPIAKRSIQESVNATDNVFCDRFIHPIETNRTFFSPIDPQSGIDTYPKSIDCTFILRAPAGYTLRLDFRNKFHIEPSHGCSYDYLEVLDGEYGFDKPRGKYCGTDFPEIIYSSGRYLWLHFHSDENIEYEGFQAVYDFVERPQSSPEEEPCYFERDGIEGYVNYTDIEPSVIETKKLNSLSLDCLWDIKVDPNSKILLSFLKFELEQKNDCESNFVDIFGEIIDIPSRMRHFCGVCAEPVMSKSNVLRIRFFADKNGMKSDFSILYTAFTMKAKGQTCGPKEYDCDDDTCINGNLTCNGRNNCKFNRDESDCGNSSDAKSDNLIIIIIVFSLILGAMTTAFLVNCIRKLIRDQRIIRQHIRESRESKLDEAGRISLKRSLENINRITPKKQQSFQSQQRSIHILDDDSNMFYRETDPLQVNDNRNDIKTENDFRNQELKENFEAKQRKDIETKYSVDGGQMCDMACQTRESLFEPPVNNKLTQAPSICSRVPSEQLRFSTFGYNNNTSSFDQRDPSEPNSNSSSRPPPPPITNQKKHLKDKHQHSAPKMEESRIYVDIRNSAPDVIIMTSQ